jgi:acyl-CoA synthetase (AMP-forming)/AMP-acid ligase II
VRILVTSTECLILCTSGSTGKPNRAGDRILSALPLSFDPGFSQLTTAFYVGASVTPINCLLPRDVVATVERERITGLTAVPPLWIQLAQPAWPEAGRSSLRYIANTGGRMPKATRDALRAALPKTLVFLMYGLTESFRSTYVPPAELERRPDPIGKAIPNAEVLVVREDGTACAPNEPGELVHRGALVSLGYWKMRRRRPSTSSRCQGKPKDWSCRRWRSGRATPCAWTKRASSAAGMR